MAAGTTPGSSTKITLQKYIKISKNNSNIISVRNGSTITTNAAVRNLQLNMTHWHICQLSMTHICQRI